LQGIDAIKDELTWGKPSDKLDVEFEEGDWVDTVMGASHAKCARFTA
jgi:hypothetical protein